MLISKFYKNQELVERPDTINFLQTIEFLELEHHFPDINIFQPLLLYEVSDFPMEITAMNYSNETNLIFISGK